MSKYNNSLFTIFSTLVAQQADQIGTMNRINTEPKYPERSYLSRRNPNSTVCRRRSPRPRPRSRRRTRRRRAASRRRRRRCRRFRDDGRAGVIAYAATTRRSTGSRGTTRSPSPSAPRWSRMTDPGSGVASGVRQRLRRMPRQQRLRPKRKGGWRDVTSPAPR